jgi:uncharacterized hydrophobic protein (TIGR00341 family)
MAQRLIQLSVRDVELDELVAYCEPAQIVSVNADVRSEGLLRVDMVVATEHSEAVMDRLEQLFSNREEFQVSLLPLEATLPRPAEPEPEAPEKPRTSNRISREELYQEITSGIKVRSTFIVMVLLSSVVAALGLYRDDTAILIGAMVIAPLLGPNIALSLAATLGDNDLASKAIKTNALGAAISLLVALLFGYFLNVTPDLPAIAHRSHVALGDIVLATASGAAGALAFTTGLPSALIGVMVAVALMPPLVAFGMLLGAGHGTASLGPLLLFATNVISLNLAAVATFMAKGIRPRTWWEAERAKSATRRAYLIWGILMAALAVLIWKNSGGGLV